MPDQALVWEDRADRPGTHVLLIGIGDYPWLTGGTSFDAAQHGEAAMGMKQLSAPPVSMRKLADWFLDPADRSGFDNPARQLASISLVLSEATPASYSHPRLAAPVGPLPRGTIAEVQAAVGEWLRRASTRRDNSVVFAFCGHGVQSGSPVLLCRDYGANLDDAFLGSIDFERFRGALSTRQPDTQLLLVDACRTPDLDSAADALLLEDTMPGNRLLKPVSLKSRDNAPARQSVQFATSLYTKAWGRIDAPSLFTEALIAALAGGGASQNEDWWVTTNCLYSALVTYMARISAKFGVIQSPEAKIQPFAINKPSRITVPLYVTSTDPAIWSEPIALRARNEKDQGADAAHTPKVPDDGIRECEIRLVNPSQEPEDVNYKVEATFSDGSTFANCTKRIIAYPPEQTCILTVSKRP